TTRPIDPEALVREVAHPGAGAILTFAGVVRDENLGDEVRAIDYHGYEKMADRELRRIEEEAEERWPGVRTRIVHRLGHLEIGDTSVLIAVSSPHRDAGFQALRYAIDTLKERAPIWKKEILLDGERWIEGS